MKKIAFVLCFCLLLSCLSSCSLLPLRKTEQPSAEEDYMQKLEELIALLDYAYVDGYDTSELGDLLAEAAVKATGDRWSYYISAEDFSAYVEADNNAYVGIGITIRIENEDDPGITIATVTPNGPADQAGLQPGDIITAVEGQPAMELGTSGAQRLVRGEEGTDVQLTLLRDGEEFDVTVTRATIETVVADYRMLEDQLGYIHIDNFNGRAAEETIAAIETLVEQGARGLIFDVRFNGGGSKDELVRLLDYLLPEGPLFRSIDADGHETVDYSDAEDVQLPMAVLVNEDSYSAAEFFAAALQEYGYGKVIGTQTCGKGNYQQTFRLSDGSAVAISTGHYRTPNNVSLTDVGITPDVVVEVDEETYAQIYYGTLEAAEDPQLQAAISALS